jgi:formylglycine-generating enzyme required for sulfatase activity
MSNGARAACAGALLAGAVLATCTTPPAQLPASRVTPLEGQRMRAVLVLDLESADRDPAEIDRLLADDATQVAMISRPDGAIWRRVRAGRPARLRVAIVEACAGGRTAACAREAARFVAAWRDAPLGPPTGTIIEDAISGSPPAPPAIVIPTGQFTTGVDAGNETWLSRHAGRSVHLVRPIAVARTETTVAQFRRFVHATGYRASRGCQSHRRDQIWVTHGVASWENPVIVQTADHPVTCVMFEDGQAYAAWLTTATGHRWRLPTEPEAEFFVRSGHAGRFGVDAAKVTDLCSSANGADRSSGLAYANACDDGFDATAPAGSFPPNAFGLFDATGNLWELTSECMGREINRVLRDNLGLAPSDASTGGDGRCYGKHVIRGGAFLSSPRNLEAALRDIENARSNRVGFRLVRELP